MDLSGNSLGLAVIVIAIIFATFDLAFIVLRLRSRRLKRVRYDASDYLIVAAFVIVIADIVRKIMGVGWGLGRYYDDLVAMGDAANLVRINKITWTGYLAWTTTVNLTKLSILVLYRALFGCFSTFKILILFMMGFVTIYWLNVTIGGFFECRPMAFIWDKTIVGGHCFDPRIGPLITACINVVMNAILVFMPIGVLWNVQHVTTAKKVGVISMFSLGLVVVIIAGVRVKYVISTHVADPSHEGELAGTLGALEMYLGIIGACLPLISPAIAEISSSVRGAWRSIILRIRPDRGRGESVVEVFPKSVRPWRHASLGWEEMSLESWSESAGR